jgi:hypothetical protein
MPATAEQAFDQIMTLFKSAWDSGASGVAVHWPNVRNDVDGARNTPADSADEWARISIQHSSGRQVSIGSPDGSRQFRQSGLITVEIYVPHSKGTARAWQLVRVALNAFRGKSTSGGLTFDSPRPREVGNDGPWFRVDALIGFKYDEVVL